MSTHNHIDLPALYPEGRTFYDETDDAAGFIKHCHGLGLCPATNFPPPGSDLEPFTTVQVPAHKLEAFYAYCETHGITIGT